MRFRLRVVLSLLSLWAVGLVAAQGTTSAAQSTTPAAQTATPAAQIAMPTAQIINDQGGAVTITGSFTINSQFYKTQSSEPLVMLEDEAGFVDRNIDFVLPPQSQIIGSFTSDFYASGPTTYEISLPIAPQGSLRDVDNNGHTDTGVQIFAPALEDNTFGPPTLESRDFRGWSTAYASTKVSAQAHNLLEITGGKLLIYAPDANQGVPSGFGADGKLFTADDPVVRLPQGYSIVDLDASPFTFDRSRTPTVDFYEPPEVLTPDYSNMTYTQAFDALIAYARQQYAFTDLKHIDWDALSAQFRPRIAQAEANHDPNAYLRAMRDFSWSIPDTHVNFSTSSSPVLDQDLLANTNGGLGLSLVELDDQRVLVNFILDHGPAQQAGIQLQAEVTAINGQPIQQAVDDAVAYSAPFSSPIFEHLQKLRYVIRFPVDTSVQISYRNPGDTRDTTVTMTTVAERSSFNYSSFFKGLTGSEAPIEFKFLDNGYAYARITSFEGNTRLMIYSWEYFLSQVQQQGAHGIILDLRQNPGGGTGMPPLLAGYFFNQEIPIANNEFYADDLHRFFHDSRFQGRIVPPPDQSQIFIGPVAVLIGPGCYSACELFAYDMTTDHRASIVGQYPTEGAGGSYIGRIAMPEGGSFVLPSIRTIDLQGNIIIEGQGVAPTVRVPVDETTAFSNGDPILDAAVNALEKVGAAIIHNGGQIAVGDTVNGAIGMNERVQYTLTADRDLTLDIKLGDATGQLDTYLRIYDSQGNFLAENDDIDPGRVLNSEITGQQLSKGDTIVIEVGTYNDATPGNYTLSVTEETPPPESTSAPA